MKIMDPESSMDVDCDSVLSFINSSKICPLCNCQLKLFFLNLTEKLLMCENAECEYPFGHTELQFIKIDNYNTDDDLCSVTSRCTRTSTGCSSVVSNIAWGDIDRMNRIYDSEDSQLENRLLNSSSDRNTVLLKSQQIRETENVMKKNVEDIRELTAELKRVESDPYHLQNKKWLQNLMRVQELSGVKLLAEEEMKKLQKKEPELGLGELKIDIAAKDDQISCIKIEINKPNQLNSSEPSK